MWRRRVLVAAEPNVQGRQVVATAIAVAAQCALPLHLVSVISGESLRAPADAFVSEMVVQAQTSGAIAQGEVRSGKPFTEILAAAATCQADLIVIGSHGNHRIGRALVGGVAQKVMGLSEHPVLVLHFQSTKGFTP
jgi:nucleotide-binding universal stress UspA family protein